MNRIIKNKVIENIYRRGLKYIDICPSNIDIDLKTRVQTINQYSNVYGKNNCLLIDLHSNAGGGNGFEIWTSPWETPSDPLAMDFYNMFAEWFPYINCRSGKSEKNPGPDKEALFYNLVNSKCPAILPEFLFFDNFDDYLLLINPSIQDKYANMIGQFCYQHKN
jgi:N-acetylmuramoyl-L-alanine amidase